MGGAGGCEPRRAYPVPPESRQEKNFVESLARKSSLPRLGLAVVAALLVTVPVALAAEDSAVVTYREQVEPICKESSDKNSQILKGVKGQVNRGALAPAGKRFIRASEAFGKAVQKIAKVPRPAAYQTTLKKWVGYLGEEKTLLQKIGKSLKAEEKNQAYRLGAELERTNKRANNTMLDFELRYCANENSGKFI
jgi:hypothetical protein